MKYEKPAITNHLDLEGSLMPKQPPPRGSGWVSHDEI